ncbi:MAG TPA: acyl-CoA dehydrogenase family protein [Conexibacter sp.]|jgi:alkylation response protein AidB-like acyl-CoA dehydrogenase
MSARSAHDALPVPAGGLSFAFTDEQQLFRQTLREFVDKRMSKAFCREVEAREAFPRDLWERIDEAGLFGIGIPEELGGQGGGIVEQVIVSEELSRTLAGLVWIWGVVAFAGAKAIGRSGSEAQRREWLPRAAAGELVFSIGLTEPGGGTDVLGAMRTRAKKVDRGWRVNGAKTWSTMAHVADVMLLVARTREGRRPSEGLTTFLIDARSPGITATPIPKLGMRALGSCDVSLDDVFVPDERVLGEVDHGWRVLSETLNSERIMVAAQCCGALEGIVDDMVSYARERVAFDKPIAQFQSVQHMIANARMGLETGRLHTYRAAWLQLHGRPCGVEATMAKVLASEAAVKAADDGIQILGGMGYALEYDMQRYWRDMRLYRIAPINNEMGRNYIGESMGLPRSF